MSLQCSGLLMKAHKHTHTHTTDNMMKMDSHIPMFHPNCQMKFTTKSFDQIQWSINAIMSQFNKIDRERETENTIQQKMWCVSPSEGRFIVKNKTFNLSLWPITFYVYKFGWMRQKVTDISQTFIWIYNISLIIFTFIFHFAHFDIKRDASRFCSPNTQ